MPSSVEPAMPTGRAPRALLGLLAAAAVLAGCATGSTVDGADASPAVTGDRTAPAADPPAPTATADADMECFGSDDPSACVPRDSLPQGWSFETQDLVLSYTTRLHEALGNNEDLLAITWDPLTVEVFWPDPLPASLDPLIAEAAAAGITIVWREIAMSQAEAEALVVQLADALTAAGIEWTAIGPEIGYGALLVGTPEALDQAAQDRIRAIAADAAPGMEIHFEVREPAASLIELEQP